MTTGECTPGSPCIMSFDGTTNCPPNSNCQNIIQFTYTTPGTYKLSVLYQSIGSDDITVVVDPNIAPAFEIFTCAGSKVEVDITDNTYDSYAIDFNKDGIVDSTIPSGNNQVATFAYASPGNYNISVRGKKLNASNNCNATVQPFTAIATLPTPSISKLTAISVDTLNLNFTPQTNIEYHANIAFNGITNFQQYKTLYGTNSLIVPNLALDKNYYCFELSSFDPCANTNTYSTPVCSQDFSLTIASGVNQLSWKTSSLGISSIQVVRTDSKSKSFSSLSGSATSYNDTAIVCKTKYCYQLVSNYPGGVTSTSLQLCGTSFLTGTPAAINNTSAVVGNSNVQVTLTWLQPPTSKASIYRVFRSQNSGTYILKDSTKTKQYTDADYSEGYHYQINYTDNCNNASAPSLPSYPIQLTGTINEMNDAILQWTNYKGWNKGVKYYTVQRFNANGQLIQSVNVGTDSTYTDNQVDAVNQVVFYKIIANGVEVGVSASVSNELKITKEVNLYYPTAFNPESKAAQVNRTFIVRGHYIAKLDLQIFDRWGTMVFFSDSNEAWDGKQNGINMPVDTYVWTAEGTDLTGNAFKKAGTVLLIRK